MRVLLSTIGSRGDVQPLVALALELRALGAEVRLCVPPDFQRWLARLGLPSTPIGPELRATARPGAAAAAPTSEQRRQMIEGTVAAQFETIGAAAEGADLIVGATALQLAAPSIAEHRGIPYVFAAYCPCVLPSPRHAPPVLGMLGDRPAAGEPDHAALWAQDAARWNAGWAGVLDARRASLGLAPVGDVRAHVLTSRPWLAADPTLAPWPDDADDADDAVFQTGAWIVPDERPLDPELEAFLDAGEPPIYFGFGSMRAPEGVADAMLAAARALGRRAVVLRGWALLAPTGGVPPDCVVVGEVNQQALFRRVAAVVHHGGAGTTTAAALAGAPQVVVPQMYDQHYFAARVAALGLGAAHAPGAPTAASLARALGEALRPDVTDGARSLAGRVRRDGARVAAERLMALA
jgi:vancomycin aglycone glucosyltransferase